MEEEDNKGDTKLEVTFLCIFLPAVCHVRPREKSDLPGCPRTRARAPFLFAPRGSAGMLVDHRISHS